MTENVFENALDTVRTNKVTESHTVDTTKMRFAYTIADTVDKKAGIKRKLTKDEMKCLVRLCKILDINIPTFRKAVGIYVFPHRAFYDGICGAENISAIRQPALEAMMAYYISVYDASSKKGNPDVERLMQRMIAICTLPPME